MSDREPRQEIPPPPDDKVMRSVGMVWDQYQRLHVRRRKIAAADNRDLSLGATVTWLLDLADKLDAEAEQRPAAGR